MATLTPNNKEAMSATNAYKLSDISMISVKHSSKSITERTITRSTLYAAWQAITQWHGDHVAASKHKSQRYDVVLFIERNSDIEVKVIKMSWPSFNEVGNVEYLPFIDFIEFISYNIKVRIPVTRDTVIIKKDESYTLYRRDRRNNTFRHVIFDDTLHFKMLKNKATFEKILVFSDWDYSYIDDSNNALYSKMDPDSLLAFLWVDIIDPSLNCSPSVFNIFVLRDLIQANPAIMNISDNSGLWARLSTTLNKQVPNNPIANHLIDLIRIAHNNNTNPDERQILSKILGSYHDNLTNALRTTKQALNKLDTKQ